MFISKNQAVKMFDELIKIAEDNLYPVYYPHYDEEYYRILDGGEELIGILFGRAKAKKYLEAVNGTPLPETEKRDIRLEHYKAALTRAIAQLNVYRRFAEAIEEEVTVKPKGDTVLTLEQLARRLPKIIHELRQRRRDGNTERPTLDVRDEYDLQDLIRALLYLYFDDVRKEEGTPSLAGTNGRMDFLLFKDKTVVELKLTRPGLKNRELKNQLFADFPHYIKHPSCKIFVAIVYDPGKLISNPAGVEADMTGFYNNLPVYTFIVQG